MKTCKKCGKEFPFLVEIDGKVRNLGGRSYCLDCSPFGSGNKIKLEDKGKNCIVCDIQLTGNQTKFCSIICKGKVHGTYDKKSDVRKRSSKEATKRWRERLNIQVENILGKTCIICDRDYKLINHRKDGKEHSVVYRDDGTRYKRSGDQMKNDVLTEPEQFVRVCWNCHKGVHWCMKYFKMSWNQILNTIADNSIGIPPSSEYMVKMKFKVVE